MCDAGAFANTTGLNCTVSEPDFIAPANFMLWPGSRIGALAIFIIYPFLFIIPEVRQFHIDLFRGYDGRCCGSCGGRFWGPIALGLFFGLWFHFIPCIWWTCDWGDYDGENTRGTMWFVPWAVISIVGWAFNFIDWQVRGTMLAAPKNSTMFTVTKRRGKWIV